MIILLPPSETKTAPAPREAAVELDTLTRPQLGQARATMMRAAVATAKAADGAGMLGVPASAPELQERMTRIDAEPAGPALEVYSGVLFDALGDARPTHEDVQVLIASALFGVVDAAADRIPAYRLSAGSSVKRLGKVGTWWKPKLAPIAKELAGHLVVDGRSGAYRSMMPVKDALDVSPVQERDGKRTVVSHDAKHYRGLVARELMRADSPATSADEVVDQLRSAFGDRLGVELDGSKLVIVDRFERVGGA
ncbi:peroxide stress protein YaaA [Helcobacillus sp. ACRRO]|uniref:YaaA family protein n=1 Tax=Helcobacillus TaxID=1161125 RepID=UPI001EF4B46E|nr:peroxide stress protein YaaA [Helcobacillus massiliensis]MCG7426546.1 peroxide stress protein YaaA [Helcobacillus sp. ACRRO]MDK7741197.1 peroxide stress protein YaaA [Helcobacillus massiliensis]WOO94003.1 peroxide stress protein YaaA [Helcobacillus massiliensis]